MYRKYLFLITAVLLGISCNQRQGSLEEDPYSRLHNADLVFVRASSSEMDGAISESTSRADSEGDFSHVAIVVLDDDSLYVVEALPMRGVIYRPLDEFVSENGDSMLVFRRLKPSVVESVAERQGISADELLSEFVMNALMCVGQPYDYVYMPDNGRCYCSELVWDSYIDIAPSPSDCHLFQSAPMNFLDSEGNLPDFWREMFEALQSPVPQGVNGTNPNDMFRDPVLTDL